MKWCIPVLCFASTTVCTMLRALPRGEQIENFSSCEGSLRAEGGDEEGGWVKQTLSPGRALLMPCVKP